MEKEPQIARSIEEMIDALRGQLRLLEEYVNKLARERRREYMGEVAAKLRLLSIKFRSNQPLLGELMRRTGIEPRLPYNGPRPMGVPMRDSWSLDEYMSEDALWIRTPSGDLAKFSKIDFVRAIAEKLGGAHEDWHIPEGLLAALKEPLFFGNTQTAQAELLGTARTVLAFGQRFVEECDRKAKSAGGENPRR